MKIAKYEHACLVIEDQGKKLIIDPGSFVRSKFNDLNDVVGIVVTHVHADHLSADHISDILKTNPEAQIFATQEVAGELNDRKVNTVGGGDQATVGPFELKFFGGQHAIIHKSYPSAQNVGVLVNNSLYYPGDSFSLPEGAAIKVLALPTSAPWLKLGEVIDFLAAVKPSQTFPTHNALNSELGESLVDQMIGGFAKSQQIQYQFLAVGETIEI